MKFTSFGIDIAKHLMQIHFVDEYTGELIDKPLRRNDFLTFFSNRQPPLLRWAIPAHSDRAESFRPIWDWCRNRQEREAGSNYWGSVNGKIPT
ncbi:hypothetical protein BB987_01780 [Photorhabdus temperata]|uniref:Transposase n=1 Tax=Photorhabdus khanii NC19 TaxID=1004151 RepID=W3V689_9GAMM|nr:hypothetical protein PTE_02570 [Photorhabdus khanii NC19]OHV54093.1 hypothetical protein BB987_01780 [Photorhabdus temperata]